MINAMLLEHHLDMPAVNEKSHDPKDFMQNVSLCGRHALTLLVRFEDFLQLILPLDATKFEKAEHKRCSDAVKAFVSYWNVLARPFDASNGTARAAKSKLLSKTGDDFVIAFQKASTSSACTYYMHLMRVELPQVVLTCPVDVHLASGMAGEQVIGHIVHSCF